MRVGAVTLRWAEALWNLASTKGVLAQVQGDVERLSDALKDPRARALLASPRLEHAARRALVEPALGGAHQLTRNFVDLAFDKGRESILVELAAAFKKRRFHEENRAEGVVESARPLGRAEIERLEASLGPVLHKKLTLENKIVPELVGGARVTAENRMIDFSVQGRLEALRRKMMEAPLPTSVTQ